MTRKLGYIVLVLLMLVALPLNPAAAQPDPCAGYGATSSTVYTSESQVNNDMADGAVSNVTIDIIGFSNDMVNVPSGAHVDFDRVTFAGQGGDGHLLEVKQNSSVDVTRSKFIGSGEDDIQLQQYTFSRIGIPSDSSSGNCFNSGSAEDAIDIKDSTNPARNVGVNHNEFHSSAHWCVLSHQGPKAVYFRHNVCDSGIYFREGTAGAAIGGNTFDGPVWLDEVNDYVLYGNTFAPKVRYGAEGTTPSNNWFKNNTFGSQSTWDFRQQGSPPCFRYNNDIRLDQCDYKAP